VARQTGAIVHSLLEERPHPERAGVLVMTSDRGLAGAYNANVLKRAEDLMGRLRERGIEPIIYVSGRKGVGYLRFRGFAIEQSWTGHSEVPTYEVAERIGTALIEAFAEHRIDELYAVYTDFRSAFTTRATDRRFLPIAPEEVVRREPGMPYPEYIFEPEPSAILDELLPQYVITKVYAALLESAASENANRRRAMKAATDNAEELTKVLTRVANQARQAEITQEIMEVVGAAEALGKVSGQ
jgi:F-type H+-transporting ATPase subunit gamma